MPIYDTTFKELAKTGLPELLRFLIPELGGGELLELPQELPLTVRSVDLLAKAVHHPAGPRLLVLECQAQREATIRKLLLLRAVLVHFYYDLPVTTLVLALTREAAVEERYPFGYLRDQELWHGVEVRRLYEEPADAALETALRRRSPCVR